MTALKPIENRRVRGTASETYPSNRVCAHPECNELVTLRPSTGEPTVHHIFPRSQINSASYFVEIDNEDGTVTVIPHAVGLCGSGTTGHHGDVEEHRAWIKLEDGVFNWYDRYHSTSRPEPIEDDNRNFPINGYGFQLEKGNGVEGCPPERGCNEWLVVGPLNPQPGSVEGKPKKKRKHAQPARKKAVYSIRVPKHEGENGYEVLDTLIDGAREKLAPDLGQSENVPAYYVIVGALAQVLQS